MLIVSKFNDYYDNIQKHGIDKTVVYNRVQESIERPENLRIGVQGWDDPIMRAWCQCGIKGVDANIATFAIGFCGVIMPVVEIGIQDWTRSCESRKYTYIYSLEDFDRLALQFNPKVQGVINEKRGKREDRGWRAWNLNLKRWSMESFFNKHPVKEQHDIFIEYGAPVVKIKWETFGTTANVEVNPRLKDIDFMKVEDPYSAYQKISQYVGGVLVQKEKDMVEISDEDMRAKKGFFEMSFKKDPGVKKPRRRGKR